MKHIEPIIFEGAVICVVLDDGTHLYKPQTIPERFYTRMYDQITCCASNEHMTERIVKVETYPRAVLATDDHHRSHSMRRWRLVEIRPPEEDSERPLPTPEQNHI
jgi:hypothetical protein